MNQSPATVMPLLELLLPLLRPGARVVATLKFFGLGRARGASVAACEAALAPLARVEACLWLLANTVHERTLLARRAAPGEPRALRVVGGGGEETGSACAALGCACALLPRDEASRKAPAAP